MTHFGIWKSGGGVMEAAFLFLRKKKKKAWAAGLFKMSHLQYRLEGRQFLHLWRYEYLPSLFPFSPFLLGVYSFNVNKIR